MLNSSVFVSYITLTICVQTILLHERYSLQSTIGTMKRIFLFWMFWVRGRKIQFFQSKAETVSTNLHQRSLYANKIYCCPLGKKLDHETNVKFMVWYKCIIAYISYCLTVHKKHSFFTICKCLIETQPNYNERYYTSLQNKWHNWINFCTYRSLAIFQSITSCVSAVLLSWNTFQLKKYFQLVGKRRIFNIERIKSFSEEATKM